MPNDNNFVESSIPPVNDSPPLIIIYEKSVALAPNLRMSKEALASSFFSIAMGLTCRAPNMKELILDLAAEFSNLCEEFNNSKIEGLDNDAESNAV